MDIANETRRRIIQSAELLFEQVNREKFPSVDQVRRHARADMNTTSSVMKEWRRQQTAAPVAVRVVVPERIQEVFQGVLIEAWQEAQSMANESLQAAEQAWEAERAESEALRQELAEAYEVQDGSLNEATEKLAAAEDFLLSKEAEIVELGRKLEESSKRFKEVEGKQADAERREREKAQRIEEISKELMEVREKEARAQSAAAEAREHAAGLSGQLKALLELNKDLMERLESRKISESTVSAKKASPKRKTNPNLEAPSS